MAPLAKSARRAFAEWGRKGGRARARRVAPARRAAIAALAARSRWRRKAQPSPDSIRLQHIHWEDPVWLEEVLSDGGPTEWRLLYQRIADHPFGETAVALAQVLEFVQAYGVTPLWKGLLQRVRGMAS